MLALLNALGDLTAPVVSEAYALVVHPRFPARCLQIESDALDNLYAGGIVTVAQEDPTAGHRLNWQKRRYSADLVWLRDQGLRQGQLGRLPQNSLAVTHGRNAQFAQISVSQAGQARSVEALRKEELKVLR